MAPRVSSEGGAGRDRHERCDGMRWTPDARQTSAREADGEAVWSWRPDAGVKLAGSIPPMMVARKPGHQGERGVSRKPSRRESRIASAEPVCSCAFFSISAHETAGAARTRLSLRPLLIEHGGETDAQPGRIAPRDCGRTSRRCLTIESKIHPR